MSYIEWQLSKNCDVWLFCALLC